MDVSIPGPIKDHYRRQGWDDWIRRMDHLAGQCWGEVKDNDLKQDNLDTTPLLS
ncbi:hypothetical protein Tco_0068450, partial [Tanacetum coccineum]